jgi:hypothetical protein
MSGSGPGPKAGQTFSIDLIQGQFNPKVTEKQDNLSEMWRRAPTT